MAVQKQTRVTPRTVRRRRRPAVERRDEEQTSEEEEEEEQVTVGEEEEEQPEVFDDEDDEEQQDDMRDDNYEEEEDDDEEQQDDENDEDYNISASGKKKRRQSSAATKKTVKVPKVPSTPSRKTTTIKTGKVKITQPKKKSASTGAKKSATSKTAETSKRKRKEEDNVFVENEIPGSLFSIVRIGDAPPSQVVNEWIDRYGEEKSEAIAELVSFAIQSCGCNAKFDSGQLDDKNLKKIVESFISEFPENMPDYPIISSHSSLRRFNKNFVEFWDALIRGCREEILFDEDFIDNLLTWLIALSSSKVRAFRHTNCLALYTIMDTLISVCQDSVKKDLAKVEKQLENARKKSKSQTKKIEELSKQCSELQGHIIELDDHMKTIFEGVFAHRFRDSVANIRALSLESVGGWILNYPSKFLTNSCLKYVGWGLNDEIPSIRSKSLAILTQLFGKEAFHAKLESFAKKFLPRIIEMAVSDADVSTSVEAIKLLTVMLRHKILGSNPEKHEPMINRITKLLFDENQSVRHFAGIFVFHNLAKMVTDNSKARTVKKKTKRLDVDLEDLLELMRDHCEEVPLVAYYVVENFWKLTNCIKDWQQIIELLTDREDELPNEEDTLNLIRLLTASVQKVNEQLALRTSILDNAKIPKNAKSKKVADEEREYSQEEMTGIVAAALPQLLDKYQAEPEKIQELVQIPKQLNLEAYTEHHLESDFDEMLKLLRDIFWKYSEPAIWRHIAQAFNHLLITEYSLKSRAKTAYDEIVREITTKLQEAVTSLETFDEEMNTKENNFAVLVALQRIREFTLVMNVDLGNLYEELSRILDSRANGEAIDDHSAQIIMTILWQLVTWQRVKLSGKKEWSEDEVETLKENRDKLVRQLVKLLDASSATANDTFDLELAAYLYLCDLFVLFTPYPPKDATASQKRLYERLTINLSNEQTERIAQFFDKAMDKELDSDPTQQEEEEAVLVQKLNSQKQRIVVALTNAICKSTASDRLARVVLSHFSAHGSAVEEAVKNFAHALKKADESTLWDHEFEAMKRKFAQFLFAPEGSDEASDKYGEFVDLVNRLALQHFWGKDKKHIALVVRMCLQYTFDNIEQRHPFLDGLNKYAVKLDKEDAKEIITLLDERVHMARVDTMDQECIDSVEKFRALLVHVSKGNKSLSNIGKKGASKGKDKDESDQEDQGEEHEEEAEPQSTPVISRVGRRRRRSVAPSRLNFDEQEETPQQQQQEESQDDDTQISDAVSEEENDENRGTKRSREEPEEDRNEHDDNSLSDSDQTQATPPVEEDEDIIVQTPAKKRKL